MKIKDLNNKDTEELFKAILSLTTEQECRDFFDDICTPGELGDITQRYTVARMLDKDMKYQDISQHTGASTATISRVNRCLVYGAGGYRLAIARSKQAKKG